jgi:hypothetical protein
MVQREKELLHVIEQIKINNRMERMQLEAFHKQVSCSAPVSSTYLDHMIHLGTAR